MLIKKQYLIGILMRGLAIQRISPSLQSTASKGVPVHAIIAAICSLQMVGHLHAELAPCLQCRSQIAIHKENMVGVKVV